MITGAYFSRQFPPTHFPWPTIPIPPSIFKHYKKNYVKTSSWFYFGKCFKFFFTTNCILLTFKYFHFSNVHHGQEYGYINYIKTAKMLEPRSCKKKKLHGSILNVPFAKFFSQVSGTLYDIIIKSICYKKHY